jgi:hypothetical protein
VATVSSGDNKVVSDDGLIELRGVDSLEDASLDDLWIAGQPLGKIIQGVDKRSKENRNRIKALEAGEVDASEIVQLGGEQLLPIQTWLLERRSGNSFKSKNKRRATYVWEAFYRQGMDGRKYRKLKSAQVKNILRDPDTLGISDPNPNTVKRVMEFVAKGTGEGDSGDPRDEENNLVWLEKEGSSNVLKTVKSDWYGFVEGQQDALTPDQADEAASSPDDPVSPENGQGEGLPDVSTTDDDVDSAFAGIDQAEAVTNAADDSVQSSVEYEADGGDITLS